MIDNLKSKIGWEFTGESKMFEGRKVFQIRSLKDFHQQGRKVGDLGGWISGSENLDVFAWVDESSYVLDKAFVKGISCVLNGSVVSEEVYIATITKVSNSKIGGLFVFYGEGDISDFNCRLDNFKLFSNLHVSKETPLMIFKNKGSEKRELYAYKVMENGKLNLIIETGCFVGSLRDFKRAVRNTHKDGLKKGNKFYYEYQKVIKEIENTYGKQIEGF